MCFAHLCGPRCLVAAKFLIIKDLSGCVYTIDGVNVIDLDTLVLLPPQKLSGPFLLWFAGSNKVLV